MKQIEVNTLVAERIVRLSSVTRAAVLSGEAVLVGHGCKLRLDRTRLPPFGVFWLTGYAADDSDISELLREAAALSLR